jgi:tRNA (guanine10-N2)-methyltransferase
LDPFVGTGSFLVACAHFQGYTMGADIDGRQLRGRSAYVNPEAMTQSKLPNRIRECKRELSMIKDNDRKSVYDNIQQYGMERRVVDNVVCDLAHHPWRKVALWDAIVCDPPYGVRAGAKKIGSSPMILDPVKK